MVFWLVFIFNCYLGIFTFWFSCKSKYKRNDIRLDVRNDLHCTLCSTKFNKGGVMGNYNGLPVFNKKVYVYGDGFYTNEIKTY